MISLDPQQVAALSAELAEASDAALEWFRQPVTVENKMTDGFDPVTEADRSVERGLTAVLQRWFADHGIFGEEYGAQGPQDNQWIIDPIDGTRAFVAGSVLWGSLVGFRHHGVPTDGWMRTPAVGETWVAISGEHYFEDRWGRRELKVSGCTELGRATLCCTHPAMFDGALRQPFDRLVAEVGSSRFGGDCTNFGLLALGFVDLVVEDQLQAYDIAPLIPIIEAAGGTVIGAGGTAAHHGGLVVAAATPALADAALAMLET